MQTPFDTPVASGDGALLKTIQMMRLAGIQQFPREVTSRRPRLCCHCHRLIRRGEKHRSWVVKGRKTGRLSDRRAHRVCPQVEQDGLPDYGPADRGVSLADWLLMAFGLAIAVAAWVAVAMMLAFG